MKILITGGSGFIGRHLTEALGRRADVRVITYDLDAPPAVLEEGLREADVIFHLAGVNRPQDPGEFATGNRDFTATLCARLAALGRRPLLVLSSSIQAVLANPYGVSKRQAEEIVEEWAAAQECRAVIFRLKNVFGKWCRPNYNSVTATFCYNIAHDQPITISDPTRKLELVYIDDVVAAFLAALEAPLEGESAKAVDRPADISSSVAGDTGANAPRRRSCEYREVPRSFSTTLGDLAARIQSFRSSRTTLVLPSFQDQFTRDLYATYLSYLDGHDFAYKLDQKSDPRGSLAEFMKSEHFGQIFVSRTKPGVTRGNHYHHTKSEKFLVVKGEGVIRFRPIQGTHIIEHRVSGSEFKVVDIPPGYTHSIENVGRGEMVTLFWASEVFDPQRPDTIFLPVISEASPGVAR